jgi:hypothetical protein
MTVITTTIVDRFTGQYASEKIFMQSLCDALALELKGHGHDGAAIVDLDWTPDEAGPLALLTVKPGRKPLTAAACSTFLKAKRANERRRAA